MNNFKNQYQTEDPFNSGGLNPDPENLIPKVDINLAVLKQLVKQSIISVHQLNKELVVEVCKLAALLQVTEISSSHPLDGNIVITAFFEASTRTRLSFESAVLRLDGKVLSIPDGKTTGMVKGESLEDIGEMFNAYGDVVIMRHTETNSVNQVLKKLRLPLINAGNGSGEHPTQAFADWYALLKWRPDLALNNLSDENKIHLGIIGTPEKMRSVKSFVLMSLLFKNSIKRISIISEMADPLGDELTKVIDASKIPYNIYLNINETLSDLDVIYMNSIAYLGDSYRSLDERFKLNSKSKLKSTAVVMHPLARLDELSTTLDETDHNLYFTQAHGAIFVRQALLISVLNRFKRLPENISSNIK